MAKAWLAVDPNGEEWIYSEEPYRDEYPVNVWWGLSNGADYFQLPEGSIKKLTGRELTWLDEPVELVPEPCRGGRAMNGFFEDEEKNRLSAIAAASKQWKLIDEGKRNGCLFQSWKCRYRYGQALRPSIRGFALCEGFDDDEARLFEFKQALVESVTTQQQRIEILFTELYGK